MFNILKVSNYEQNVSLKRNIIILKILVFLLGIGVVIILCFDCRNTERAIKNQILNENYHQILQLSVYEIDAIIQQIIITSDNANVKVTVDKNNIQACFHEKCKNYDLLKIRYALNKLISAFINYKIELNKALRSCRQIS